MCYWTQTVLTSVCEVKYELLKCIQEAWMWSCGSKCMLRFKNMEEGYSGRCVCVCVCVVG